MAPVMLMLEVMTDTKRRVGRPVSIDPRVTRVVVRLSGAECERIDSSRGDLTRADYLRSSIPETPIVGDNNVNHSDTLTITDCKII